MTALHERFAELADTSTPPSRLSADGVYGRARRRRRTRLAVSLAGGLSVLVGAGTAVVLSDLPKNESATPGHATVSTSSTADPGAWIYDGAVYGAAATDAQHLYALVNLCPTPTNCTGSLFGSDDGGHIWTLRSDHLFGDLTVHTPGELT